MPAVVKKFSWPKVMSLFAIAPGGVLYGKDIATALDCSRETVSDRMKEGVSDGLFTVEGGEAGVPRKYTLTMQTPTTAASADQMWDRMRQQLADDIATKSAQRKQLSAEIQELQGKLSLLDGTAVAATSTRVRPAQPLSTTRPTPPVQGRQRTISPREAVMASLSLPASEAVLLQRLSKYSISSSDIDEQLLLLSAEGLVKKSAQRKDPLTGAYADVWEIAFVNG